MRFKYTTRVATFRINKLNTKVAEVEVTNFLQPNEPKELVKMLAKDEIIVTTTFTINGTLWDFVKASFSKNPVDLNFKK